jgi:cellobiose phosphorylase
MDSAPCHNAVAAFTDGVLRAWLPLRNNGKMMFTAIPGHSVHYTVSGYEFFGIPGNNILPEALKTAQLSDSTGRGASVLALQTTVTIKTGETAAIPLLMGYGTEGDIAGITAALGGIDSLEARLAQTIADWRERTLGIRVTTPHKSFDMLVNGWLMYQTYTARLWGRTGYYQSGGAYGFRDQLQDVLALLYTDPDTTRAHILKCAAHQFIEGDVLHWWHEPARGVRTRISRMWHVNTRR